MATLLEDFRKMSTDGASSAEGYACLVKKINKEGGLFLAALHAVQVDSQIIFAAQNWNRCFSLSEKRDVIKYFRSLPGIALTIIKICASL